MGVYKEGKNWKKLRKYEEKILQEKLKNHLKELKRCS